MGRPGSLALARLPRPAAPVLLLLCVLARAVAGQEAPAVNRADGPGVAVLLDRGDAIGPGTYVLSGTSAERATAEIPILVQADVVGATKGAVRVAIVVGAHVARTSEVRIRLLRLRTGGATTTTPTVVGEASGSGEAGPVRFVREFELPPGEYEIRAAVGHAQGGGVTTAALARAPVVVPDLSGGPLAIAPVVLGESTAAAARGEIRPFTFGPTALTPAVQARFAQHGALDVAFRVFNWKADAGDKPDVTVEYLFYQQGTKRLTFFNKIKPQHLSAETLGDRFDPSSGTLNAGMLVPLAAFPPGEFQLTVRVTDNRTKQSAARDVRFTVAP